MIRLVAFVAFAALIAWVVVQIVRALRGAKIDWTGVTFMIGFVVLAFWLRHVTGMG